MLSELVDVCLILIFLTGFALYRRKHPAPGSARWAKPAPLQADSTKPSAAS
jgi:hypothetical protein